MSYTLTTLREKAKRRIRVLTASSPTGSEAEKGSFSNASIDDAINAGRKQIMIAVRNAELWGSAEAVFETAENIQEYSLGGNVLRIDAVQYDVTAAGLRNSDTVDALNVRDRKGEEAAISDPMNEPSVTNPKYRVTNRGIRLTTSTDGSVVKEKYIRVEFLKELSDLTAIDDTSGLTGSLDELVVDWSVWVLCMLVIPQVAQAARSQFYQQAGMMNQRGF